MLRNGPLTTEGALKWISSKLPSNMVLNAGSAKQAVRRKNVTSRQFAVAEVEAEVCGPTAGSEDDRPLGGGHERLDGGEETRVVVKNDVDFLKQDEGGGRLLALLLAALFLWGGCCYYW